MFWGKATIGTVSASHRNAAVLNSSAKPIGRPQKAEDGDEKQRQRDRDDDHDSEHGADRRNGHARRPR